MKIFKVSNLKPKILELLLFSFGSSCHISLLQLIRSVNNQIPKSIEEMKLVRLFLSDTSAVHNGIIPIS